MLLDSSRKAKNSILVSIAFVLTALIFNHLLRPVFSVIFARPPSEPFLLMEGPGLVLGVASTLLFWIGRGLAHRISVRGVLTVLGTILGLYVIIFVMLTPASWSTGDMAFLMLTIVALDCWLCLGFLAVVEMMIGRPGVGEA